MALLEPWGEWTGKIYSSGWQIPATGEVLSVRNPMTGDLLGEVGRPGAVGVAQAAQQAAGAQAEWARVSFRERANVLRMAGELLTAAIGGVRVHPGDWMLGDGDGVVCVPRERLDEVVEAAVSIRAAEELIRHAVEEGHSLRQARERVGYHSLQTHRSAGAP